MSKTKVKDHLPIMWDTSLLNCVTVLSIGRQRPRVLIFCTIYNVMAVLSWICIITIFSIKSRHATTTKNQAGLYLPVSMV